MPFKEAGRNFWKTIREGVSIIANFAESQNSESGLLLSLWKGHGRSSPLRGI